MTDTPRPLPYLTISGRVSRVEETATAVNVYVDLGEGEVEPPVSFTTSEPHDPDLADRARNLAPGARVVLGFSYLGPKESPTFLGRDIEDAPRSEIFAFDWRRGRRPEQSP